MNTDVQLKNALEYLSFAAKEGQFDEDSIVGKTREEIIKIANDMIDRSDWEYEQQREQ